MAQPATAAVSVAPAAELVKPAPALNPYGIEALWATSDAITKTVLLLLAIMSMGSWYFLVVKVLEQAKMNSQAKKVTQDFWAAPSLDKGVATLVEGSAYQFIAQSGLEATKRHVGLVGQVPLTDWISMSISRSVEKVNGNMQSGLAFLATVGSTSPFVGLFGTVWGIMHAFTGLAALTQVTLATVAPGIAEALVATAIGLFAAIPAVVAYNRFARDIDRIAIRLETFIEEFSNILQRNVGAQSASGH